MNKNKQKSIIDTINSISNRDLNEQTETKKRKTNIFNPDVTAPLPFPFSPITPEYMPEVGEFLKRQENEIAQYIQNKKSPKQVEGERIAQAAMVDQPHGQYEGPDDEAPWNKTQNDMENDPYRFAPESNPERFMVDIMGSPKEPKLPSFMRPFTWQNIINDLDKKKPEASDSQVKIPGPDLQTSRETEMSDASRWPFPTSRNIDFNKEDEEEWMDLEGPDEQGIYTINLKPKTEPEENKKPSYTYNTQKGEWIKDLPFPSVDGVDPFEIPRGQYEGPDDEAPWNKTPKEKTRPVSIPGIKDPFDTPKKPKQSEWSGSPSPYEPRNDDVLYTPLSDPKEAVDRVVADILKISADKLRTPEGKLNPNLEREIEVASLEREKQTATPEQAARVERSAKGLNVEPWTPEHSDAVKARNEQLKRQIAKYEEKPASPSTANTSSAPVMITKMNKSGEYELVPADLSNEEDLRRIQPGSASYEQLSPEDKARRNALKENRMNYYHDFITESTKLKSNKSKSSKNKKNEPLKQVSVSEPVNFKPGSQWAPPEGYKGKITIKNIKPIETGLFSQPKEPPPSKVITSPSKLKKLGIAAAILGGIAGGAVTTHLATKSNTVDHGDYTYNTETGEYNYKEKDMKSLKEYKEMLSSRLEQLEEATQQERAEARAKSMGFNLGSGHPRSRGGVNVSAIKPERLGPHLQSIISSGGGERTYTGETPETSQETAKQPSWGERLKPHIITLMGAAQDHKIELSKEEAVSNSADRKRLLAQYKPGSDVHKAAQAVDEIMKTVKRD